MKKHTIEIPVEVYTDKEELSPQDQNLLNEATKALEGSYAPYSKYHVGAAVLLENGAIIHGGNQENVAYPSGLCAERVALFAASSKYPDIPVVSIAITAHAEEFKIHKPVPPCGSCRQVMAETETRFQKPIRVIMGNSTGEVYITKKIGDLLPLMFEAIELKKK